MNRLNAFEWVLNIPSMLVSACECQWVSIEHPLKTCECMWTPMSDYWTPPEHPLSVHERQWVSIEQPLNIHWVHMNTNEWVGTPIECAWPSWSHYLAWLTMVWPWNSSHLCRAQEHLWVSIEHPLNACECAWMPLSPYWTPPECLWVHVSANEWVGTSPEHPLSVHESFWVSIRKVWMRTSRVINLTNL